jgi:tryptophan-rich sensory protein
MTGVRIGLGDAVAVGSPLAVAAVGGVATAAAIPGWYRTLDKPPWNPPDAIFAPVWTTLYVLMGVAMVLARRAAPERRDRTQPAFALQLALNLAWSLAFFGGRSPSAGVAVIVLLWAAIVATIAEFGRASRLAALLMAPYLAWVTFAAVLNVEIWRRNAR